MKNKRILFPIIISVIVIVIAIIIFILIGSGEKNNKSNSTIKLSGNSENSSKSNTVDNTDDEEDNTVDNDTDNATDENTTNDTSNNTTNSTSDDSIDFDGDEFYLKSAKAFVAGLMNSDDMKDFVDKHVDVKAYVACYDISADDAKFMDEYQKLSDDDDKVLEVSKKFEELASEKNLKLDAISNPKTSGDDENISRVTITLKKGDSTEKYRMVFYGDIVIYIADDSGDSIIDLND
jgi:lipopolysaccharide export LptBFGC system permease protein LptF